MAPRSLRLLAAVAFCAAAASALASDSSNFNVQIPKDLYKEGGYKHKEALFGIPSYGKGINAKLYDSKSTLCDDAPLNIDFDVRPFVLMVDRGDCHFVAKVRRAQHLGAAAVVVADNTCLCEDVNASPPRCVPSEEFPACQPDEPIMADDGSGNDITVPSVLIQKQDAEAIRLRMEQGAGVMVKIEWSLPAPDDRVEWELWSSAADMASHEFKAQFADVERALGRNAYFEPFYFVFNGLDYNCHEDLAGNVCGDQCTNGGRYCYPDPDGHQNVGLSGADIIRENLRQKCIWREYGGAGAPEEQQGVGSKWWDYVNAFNANCFTATLFNSQDCVRSAMVAAGVDFDAVNRCISSAGGYGDNDNANTVLDGELAEKAQKGVVIIPSVFINQVFEKGGLTPGAVLTGICAGYLAGTAPSVCNCAGLATAEDIRACAVNDGMPVIDPDGERHVVNQGVSAGGVVGIILAVLIGVGGLAYAYYYYSQKRLRDEVRDVLAEYVPLDDQSDETTLAFSEPSGAI